MADSLTSAGLSNYQRRSTSREIGGFVRLSSRIRGGLLNSGLNLISLVMKTYRLPLLLIIFAFAFASSALTQSLFVAARRSAGDFKQIRNVASLFSLFKVHRARYLDCPRQIARTIDAHRPGIWHLDSNQLRAARESSRVICQLAFDVLANACTPVEFALREVLLTRY